MTYHVDIVEFPEGRFRAMCRDTASFVISLDPEHDWCNAVSLTEPDGPVQFYRDGIPSLSHSSIHEMGKRRIELGQRFPHQRPKRREFEFSRRGENAHGV